MSFDLVHASPGLIRETKSEIAALERMLETDKRSGRNQISDESLFKAEISQKKQILTKFAPKRLTEKTKNKAYTRAKSLRASIEKKLPGHQSMQVMYPKASDGYDKHQDFEEAVKSHMIVMQDPKLQSDIREYKHLMQRLDAAPGVGSIEQLRGGHNVRIRR